MNNKNGITESAKTASWHAYRSVGAILLSVALVASLAFTNIVHTTEAFGETTFGSQTQSIIDAFKLQAQHRVEAGANMPVYADGQQTMLDAEQLVANGMVANGPSSAMPETFDLRHADLDGNGQYQNYVTSVKFQNPWGTCWAFAGIAASETSILGELRQDATIVDAQGVAHDAIDLSEHHLAWFNYTPITAAEVPTQAGEGSYSMVEERATGEFAESQRMGTGGTFLSTTSQLAMGTGVVVEPDASDPSLSDAQAQLLYRGKNQTTSTTSRGSLCYSKDDLWSIDNALRFTQSYVLEEGFCLPAAATFDRDGNYSVRQALHVSDLIKQQLMQGRAVSVAFCADTYSPDKVNKAAKYINTDTWAHYTYDKTNSNHEVTIVGWDDNFSVENFLSQVQKTDSAGNPLFDEDGQPIMIDVDQPPANGAWIVKNSWGAAHSIGQGLNNNAWGLDGEGYFYLSYFDKSIVGAEAYDFDVITPASERTTITHQYDYLPSEQARGILTDEAVTCANVFTAQENQTLKAIGVMTSEENETANYRIYRLRDASQRIDEGELLCDFTRKHEIGGYHRIELENAITLQKGEVFAITVTRQSSDGYILGAAYDYNRQGFEAGLPGDQYYSLGIVNRGESFLYTAQDDAWTDWADVKTAMESSENETCYFTYDNFPIKAFAVAASGSDPSGGGTGEGGDEVAQGDIPATGDDAGMAAGLLGMIGLLSFAVLAFAAFSTRIAPRKTNR